MPERLKHALTTNEIHTESALALDGNGGFGPLYPTFLQPGTGLRNHDVIDIVQSLSWKIESAGALEQVVCSMKVLAAASVEQYQEAVRAFNHYPRTVELGLAACLRLSPHGLGGPTPPRPGQSVIALVIGSDEGLVGRFNEVLVDYVLRTLGSMTDVTIRAWVVGGRVETLPGQSGLTKAAGFDVPMSVNRTTSLGAHILVELERAR